MAFLFSLRQLVTVPNTVRQGEVMARTDVQRAEPAYELTWQVGGLQQRGWFAESEIVAANAPAPAATRAAVEARSIARTAKRKPNKKPARKKR